MCDKVVPKEHFVRKYCPDKHKTQEMIHKGDIFFQDVDSNIITFLMDDMGFNTIDLNNINLGDDNNFDEDDPETINHVRLMAWPNRCKQQKVCRKERSKELMPVAWHPTKLWDWHVSKNEKKKNHF